MALQIGYIDDDGHPCIKVRVTGRKTSLEIDALIDTGFTGFFMLPKSAALPLDLRVMGTGAYIYANGSMAINPVAEGDVTLGPSLWMQSHGADPGLVSFLESAIDEYRETIKGGIVLAGDGALIGMELIRNLNKHLIIGGRHRDTFGPDRCPECKRC